MNLQMTALKSFNFGGHRLSPGADFEVKTRAEARVLFDGQFAEFAREGHPPEVEPTAAVAPETPAAPKFVRKDVRAPKDEKPKRQYKRRDMRAEA